MMRPSRSSRTTPSVAVSRIERSSRASVSVALGAVSGGDAARSSAGPLVSISTSADSPSQGVENSRASIGIWLPWLVVMVSALAPFCPGSSACGSMNSASRPPASVNALMSP